jgi:hypothetical protein
MSKAGTTALLTAAAASIACQSAAAEPTARVDYRDQFTTTAPGAPSGRMFHDEFFNAQDASAKPPPVQHVHVQLPHGARFNWRAVPLCTASDAQLMAEGESACPAASKVGSEVYSFDTGVEGPNRIVTSDIAFLNNKDELIILTRERQSGTRVATRGKLGPETFDFDLPPLPGTPPDGGADKLEDAKYPVSVGHSGKAWLTTPPTCPATGKWTFRVDYTFRNGEKITKTSDSPCRRARIAFFRRQHGGSMRVYASAPTSAWLRIYRRSTRLYARRVRLTRGVNRLSLPSLRTGTYRLTLGGRRATLKIG